MAKPSDELFTFLHDTIRVKDVSGDHVTLASVLYGLRKLHIWTDIKDKCYAEGAALVRDRIEQDAINLPIVGLAIRKRSAILLLMASCVLIGLLMRLNLLGANRLFITPLRVQDLDAAYTSAYIGTNATRLAVSINYALLLVMPLLGFVLLTVYSMNVTPAWQLFGMVALTSTYVVIAIANVRLMNAAVRIAHTWTGDRGSLRWSDRSLRHKINGLVRHVQASRVNGCAMTSFRSTGRRKPRPPVWRHGPPDHRKPEPTRTPPTLPVQPHRPRTDL